MPKHKNQWQLIDEQINLIMPTDCPFTFLETIKSWNMTNWDIFEWGSNQSTAWFAKKCKTITSVTHNIEDYNDIKNYLMFLKVNNYIIKLKQREEVILNHYVLGSIQANIYADYGENSEYVQAINEDNQLYDCIFINGFHMAACAKQALNHIKPNGIIIINHVNRACIGINMNSTIQLLDKYEHHSFPEGLENLSVDRRTDYWIIN